LVGLVGLLMGLLRRRLQVGLLWRRPTFRRRIAPRRSGGLAAPFALWRLALGFGELLFRVRLPGVTRRMAGLTAVFEAVAAPLRPPVAQLGLLTGLLLARPFSAGLPLVTRLRIPTRSSNPGRLGPLARPAVALARLVAVGPRLLALARRLSLAPRSLALTPRLLVARSRLLSVLRGALQLLILRDVRRGNLLPGDVVALVSGVTAVSEARLALVRLESLGPTPTAFVGPGGNRDVLALEALFHVGFDLLGTTLVFATASAPGTAPFVRSSSIPASLLSASLPVSVVSHRYSPR
jgi:hypothetical protein